VGRAKQQSKPIAPRWTKDDAVAAFVAKHKPPTLFRADLKYLLKGPKPDAFDLAKAEALAAAKAGDLAPVEKLIDDLRAGKLKRREGRPRRTAKELFFARLKSVMPEAEWGCVDTINFLRQHYPEQTYDSIRDRAVALTAKKYKIQRETLVNYMNRANNDRRRLLPKLGHATAIFRQVNKNEPFKHHDALEFPNGRIVLLTKLSEGQEVTVLQLPAQPTIAAEANAWEHIAHVG